MGVLEWFHRPVSKAAFAHLLMQGVQRAGGTRLAVYRPDEFRIELVEDGKSVGRMNLATVYSEYCLTPRKERPNRLKTYLRILLSLNRGIPDEFEDAAPDLYLAVRSRGFLETMRLEGLAEGTNEPATAGFDLAEFLQVHLVYDWREAMCFVPSQTLETWGVSLYEAIEVAKQNLERSTTQFGCLDGHVYVSATNDNYDSARLLLVDMLQSVIHVPGELVAMVPNRGELLLTGTEDEKGLELMLNVATKWLREPRAISGIPLRLVNDAWERWSPPMDHPLHARFRELELASLGKEYEDQKLAYERLFQKKGLERLVAGFMAVQLLGEAKSLCIWPLSVRGLLPRTDLVLLGLDDQALTTKLVAWEAFAEVLGSRLELVDGWPPRYLTPAALDASDRQRLESLAQELPPLPE